MKLKLKVRIDVGHSVGSAKLFGRCQKPQVEKDG
jgi:hypothetical protein